MFHLRICQRPCGSHRSKTSKSGFVYLPVKAKEARLKFQRAVLSELAARWIHGKPVYFPKEARISYKLGIYIKNRPSDIDNYVKFFQDALNGVLWYDDKSIKRIHDLELFEDPKEKKERYEAVFEGEPFLNTPSDALKEIFCDKFDKVAAAGGFTKQDILVRTDKTDYAIQCLCLTFGSNLGKRIKEWLNEA